MFIPEDEPVRAEIPDAPNVSSLVANYKGKAEIAVGEEFDPSPDNIDSRTNEGKFASGMEYAFLSKENRGDAVVANMRIRYGNPVSLKGKNLAAQFAAMMLNKGTETMTRQEIQDKLDGMKGRLSVFGGLTGATVRMETTNENLAEVMEMAGEVLKQPTFPVEEFEKLKEEQLASIEESLSDPQALASEKFGKLLSDYDKNDVRYSMTMEERIVAIKALTLDDVKAFYNEFYGTSKGTLSIVGDFDEEMIKGKAEKLFGDWKNKGKYQRIDYPYAATQPSDAEIETPDKANSMFFAGMEVPVNDSHDDYAAMLIGNYILGGGFLNSRLATRIRREEGLSYGVGSWFNASAQDDGGSFGAYAIAAPENTAKVQAAFKEEIMKVITDGFTAEELEAAKSGWLQAQMVSRSQDNRLTGELSSNLWLDRSMGWDKNLEEKVSNLTVDDLNKAMKAYIHPDKMVYVKAGDFAKVKKEMKP